MKNFIEVGDTLKWTNATGADVASGDVVVLASGIGIAQADIADTESGVLAMSGVFQVKKKTGISIAVGDELYWHATDGITKTNTDNPAGIAWSAQESADVLVNVKLMPKI